MYDTIQIGLQNVPGAPLCLPPGVPSQTYVVKSNRPPPPDMPGEGLKRAMNYLADYGGCGYYRCIAPNLMLNLYQKAVVMESISMIGDPNFYRTVETVKFQRQATPHQRDFVKFVSELKKQTPLKLMYEVDDVVFADDIPLYNRNRDAFTPPEIQASIKEILSMMDEITVTCDYFKDLIIERTGHKKVTVIPNYLMKWWFDRYYDLGNLVKAYEKNKKKPVIAIFASGTHCDVLNRTNLQDDFALVAKYISNTRKDFNWHFYGSYPLQLKHLVASGEIKFFPWVELPDFPRVMANSGAQITFACLQDNHFNRSKSNIKLIEAGALGMPCVCPDMVTYKDATLKYKTGDEFIDQIKAVLKNQTVYANHCKQARAYADKFWLDDEPNLMKHHEALFTPYGSPQRKYLV